MCFIVPRIVSLDIVQTLDIDNALAEEEVRRLVEVFDKILPCGRTMDES